MNMTQTAIINKDTAKGVNGKSHRKENHFMQSYILLCTDKSGIRELAQLRLYGTQSTNYACLWVHDSKSETYVAGSGKSGGYGYHRPSAAAQVAFDNAGISLSEAIDGCGDSAIENAMKALGAALGIYSNIAVINAHA
jgi:hypothetical protein